MKDIITDVYESDLNNYPVITYCVECYKKDQNKIGKYIHNGDSLCEEHLKLEIQ